MRVFYEPITIGLVAFAAIGAISAISGGLADEQEAKGEARFLKLQASQEERQQRRDARDESEAGKQRIARMRAVLAGRGVELGSGTATGLLAREGAETAIRLQRSASDSDARRQTLLARASNTKQAGKRAKTQGFLDAGSSLLGGAFGPGGFAT